MKATVQGDGAYETTDVVLPRWSSSLTDANRWPTLPVFVCIKQKLRVSPLPFGKAIDQLVLFSVDPGTSERMSRFRSLWQASVNATKKALTWELEEWAPPVEKCIFKFSSKEDLKTWHLYSDSEYGGLSSASLEIKDGGNGSDFTGVFSGNLSTDMSEGSKWNINRSGFCGMRSKKFDGFIDLDGYDSIALRLKGDGRCYISTIYTENWVNSPGQAEDNSWQAFVFAPKGNWYTAKVPLARYLPTWKGNVIDAEMEMNPGRVVGMSLSVNSQGGGFIGAKLGAGDFRVEIDWIKALRIP